LNKFAVINKIQEERMVAVIRSETRNGGKEKAEAVAEGGISLLEITYTIPEATNLIKDLASQSEERNWIVGAGTVLDAYTAKTAIENGASFIVSPTFDPETAKLCNLYQIPYIPGCMTLNEMKAALESGCDVVKLFPGNSYGPSFVKSVKAPLPQLNIMPSGGVSLDNVKEWFDSGVIAVSAGGSLTKGTRKEIREKAQSFVQACQSTDQVKL